MELLELAAAAQKVAKELKSKRNAVLNVVVSGENVEFAAGGDRRAIISALATVISNDSDARNLVLSAVKLAASDGPCDCPACRMGRETDPSVN